jgi:hypothetical protein
MEEVWSELKFRVLKVYKIKDKSKKIKVERTDFTEKITDII